MSGTPTSPTFLPAAPSGVRRMNHLPLYAGCTVLLLAAGFVAYASYERLHPPATAEAQKEGKKPKAGDGNALTDLLARSKAHDAPAPAGSTPALKDTPAMSTSIYHDPAPADANAHSLMADARIQAWQNYVTRTQELDKVRYDTSRMAMDADLGFSNSGSSNAGSTPDQLEPGHTSSAVSIAGRSEGFGEPTVPSIGGGPQLEKQRFANQPTDLAGIDEDLAAVKHAAKPNTIMSGTPIPATTVLGSTSDMPGLVRATVDAAICDSMTGSRLLIPQGSVVEGRSDNQVSSGQTRQGVIWTRVVFPDTSSIQIGNAEGADQAGYAGEHDLVDTHFWDKFMSAAVISFAGAGAALAQPQQSAFSGYSPASVATGQLTQQFSQLGQEYARAGLSVPNTLTIRPGYRLMVLIRKDVHLPPYVDQRSPGAERGCSS